MPQLIWLITGCSTGIGLELSKAILTRGDKVIATARAPISRLSELEAAGADVLELDVTTSQDDINVVATKAIDIYGRVDVLICNAGYGEMGILEDISAEQWSKQLAVNLFGAINVVNAFLPHFRNRKSGTIGFVSSVYAHVATAASGAYTVSKFALNGYAKTLAKEVEHLNIKPIIFDTGYINTPIMSNFNVTPTSSPDYQALTDMLQNMMGSVLNNQPGDPVQYANRVIDVVKGEGLAAGKPTPLNVPMGSDAFLTVKVNAEKTLESCGEWEELARSVDYPGPKRGLFAELEHYA